MLGRLIAVAENYPDLKTSQTVNDLMGAVKEVENEIARHRYTYNNIAQHTHNDRYDPRTHRQDDGLHED